MRIILLFSLIIMLLVTSCERIDNDPETPVLKLYGDALEDIGLSISKGQNGYFIGGQFTEVVRSGDHNNYIEKESSVKKMAVLKTDTEGNLIWKKYFGNGAGALGSKIISLTDGSAVCAGYIVDEATAQKNIYIVKVSPDGENTREIILNGNGTVKTSADNDGNQFAVDICPSENGFLLLASTDAGRLQGSTGNAEGKTDIFLLKLDYELQVTGDPVIMGFPGNDQPAAIKQNREGGYIIAATTDRSEAGMALNNILIISTNAAGSAVRMRIIGNEEDEYASDLEVEDDGYFIAGTSGASGADQSVYMSKLPVNIYAEPLFQRKYKINSGNAAVNSFSVKAISKYKSNSYVVAGFAGSGSSARMLVFVADYFGWPVQDKSVISAADGSQVAYDVVTDDNNRIIAVGKNSFETNSLISFYRFRF
ncbi:MAG TPA: hypothetical protein VK213_05450 [Bacteroidales bacterium]|nr:hypothetical protein [Bacteroidales bacterium]